MKKRILAFGDSNTWGYDVLHPESPRFSEEIRWPMVMARHLGEGFAVLEEGLNGRTTVFEDPLNEGMSGISYLAPCLKSHYPLDLVIVMLGTNDCKERFSATAANIALGLDMLLTKAERLDTVWRDKPRFLVFAPGPILKECEASPAGHDMGICSDKSYGLAQEFLPIAKKHGAVFFDLKGFVEMNQVDYMHLTASSHRKLGEKAARLVKELFETDELH